MDTRNETLTTTPAQRSIVPKKDFEEQLELLIWLYRQYPEELHLDGVTPEALEAELDAYRAVRATEESAKQNLAALKAHRSQRGISLRTRAFELYAHAQGASRTNGRMERFLDGLEAMRAKAMQVEQESAVGGPSDVQH
jgi:hypothetical protein